MEFELSALLADSDRATELQDCAYATIYLAPYNYHRMHMPVAATLAPAAANAAVSPGAASATKSDATTTSSMKTTTTMTAVPPINQQSTAVRMVCKSFESSDGV